MPRPGSDPVRHRDGGDHRALVPETRAAGGPRPAPRSTSCRSRGRAVGSPSARSRRSRPAGREQVVRLQPEDGEAAGGAKYTVLSTSSAASCAREPDAIQPLVQEPEIAGAEGPVQPLEPELHQEAVDELGREKGRGSSARRSPAGSSSASRPRPARNHRPTSCRDGSSKAIPVKPGYAVIAAVGGSLGAICWGVYCTTPPRR